MGLIITTTTTMGDSPFTGLLDMGRMDSHVARERGPGVSTGQNVLRQNMSGNMSIAQVSNALVGRVFGSMTGQSVGLSLQPSMAASSPAARGLEQLTRRTTVTDHGVSAMDQQTNENVYATFIAQRWSAGYETKFDKGQHLWCFSNLRGPVTHQQDAGLRTLANVPVLNWALDAAHGAAVTKFANATARRSNVGRQENGDKGHSNPSVVAQLWEPLGPIWNPMSAVTSPDSKLGVTAGNSGFSVCVAGPCWSTNLFAETLAPGMVGYYSIRHRNLPQHVATPNGIVSVNVAAQRALLSPAATANGTRSVVQVSGFSSSGCMEPMPTDSHEAMLDNYGIQSNNYEAIDNLYVMRQASILKNVTTDYSVDCYGTDGGRALDLEGAAGIPDFMYDAFMVGEVHRAGMVLETYGRQNSQEEINAGLRSQMHFAGLQKVKLII